MLNPGRFLANTAALCRLARQECLLAAPISRRFSLNLGQLRNSYSQEDKSYILQKINQRDLPSKSIGQSNANKILAYLERNKLDNLEDLLKVNGIGPRLLKKVCDKILDARDGKDSSEPVVKKKREVQLVAPPIDEARRKSLKEIVGIHIGHESISWALVDSVRKEVIDWSFEEYVPETGSLFQHLHIVEKVSKEIPTGDIYILEDNSSGRQRQDHQRSALLAMLVTSFQLLRGKPLSSPVVSLVKPILKNQVYNALVGSERVSIQNHVVDMMEERSTIAYVSIPRELKALFNGQRGPQREDLAHSLLLATAFIKVVMNKQAPNVNSASSDAGSQASDIDREEEPTRETRQEAGG